MADQSLSSLTNFALNVVVARSVSPAGFGAFGIAYATYVVALAVVRGLVGEPLTVAHSAGGSAWRPATTKAAGAGLAVGLVAGMACLAAAAFVGPAQRTTLLVLAVMLPPLLLQDVWRFAFFARGTPSSAFLNDLSWAAALVPGLLVLTAAAENPSPAAFVLVWGVAATVAAVAGIAQSRGVVPRPAALRGWLQDHGGLARPYLAEGAASHAAFQLTLYALAGFAGLAAAGALRAGLVAFGPALVMLQGLRLVAVSEGVRLLHRSPARFRSAITLVSAVMASGAAAWGIVVVLVPRRLGVALLGPSWDGARSVALPLGVVLVALAVEMGAVVGLRALGAARRSLRARLVEASLAVAAGSAGAAAAGATGTAWFLAGAFAAAAAFWWAQFLAALAEPASSGRALAIHA